MIAVTCFVACVFCCSVVFELQSLCLCTDLCEEACAFCVEFLPTCPTFVSFAFFFRVGRCRLWGAHRMHDLPNSALQCTVRNEMNGTDSERCSYCSCCTSDGDNDVCFVCFYFIVCNVRIKCPVCCLTPSSQYTWTAPSTRCFKYILPTW